MKKATTRYHIENKQQRKVHAEEKRLALSVVVSVLSVMLGLAPFYCMYRLICLFVAGEATAALTVRWCLWSLLAYALKIVLFCLSTGVSHAMA